ncbi:NifB/NifX family molybdenum-iron cluster-binding protein [candidate division WOR-3 bacterium]|nr:NifB/NifX family molybdenum-iron cluster-binding protein [candidate division WOR-3 bacterium]
MKIALTCAGNDLSSPLDQRFGRAENFIVYNLDDGTFTVVDNKQNADAAGGAGVQSAQMIAKSGASALITGHTGPKAFQVLQSSGVKIYHSNAKSVAEAIEEFKGGKLKPAEDSDVNSHWV